MKIENKPIEVTRRGRNDGEWSEFMKAVPKLKVGQSVLVRKNASNYRLAMAMAREWLGINLSAKKEGDKWRIGRIQ